MLKQTILWIAVLAAAAVAGALLGSLSPAGASTVVPLELDEPFEEIALDPFTFHVGHAQPHEHGGKVHTHGAKHAEKMKRILAALGRHAVRLVHDDPERPDESHNYDVQPKDGTTVIRWDDGTSSSLHVAGNMASYNGPDGETRMLFWDPHGGGHWIDPEDPDFALLMYPPFPPEFPVARAVLMDMSAGPGNYVQNRGTW